MLRLENINVRAATLNNYQTMSCAMGMAGCVPNSPEATWQALLASKAPELPVFQDTEGGPVWDAFGAGHDDLMVYDRNGLLFAWLPSAGTVRMSRMAHNVPITGPMASFGPDLTKSDGYAAVRAVAILAASASDARCPHIGGDGGSSAAGWILVLLAIGVLIVVYYIHGKRKGPPGFPRELTSPQANRLP